MDKDMIGTSGDFITGLLTGNNSQTPNCCAAAMSGLTSKDLYRLLRSFGKGQCRTLNALKCTMFLAMKANSMQHKRYVYMYI